VAQPTLTFREFAQKGDDNATKEKADPTGTTYAFEKAVTKGAGGDGFADVRKKDSALSVRPAPGGRGPRSG
jgi:hypothetical protein